MFGQGRETRQAALLYNRLVRQAREPVFYGRLGVPDTIEGRFELVVLHCYLAMRRLRELGREGAPLAQSLLDYMFSDFDRSIREIGVSDMSVGKYIKRLGKSFYGRAQAYDEALAPAADRSLLAAAMRRNVLGTSDAAELTLQAAAVALSEYVRASDIALAHQPIEAFQAASLSFLDPGQREVA